MPATTASPPMTAHFGSPVIKLPGSILIPCRNQTPPARIRKTPAIFNPVFIVFPQGRKNDSRSRPLWRYARWRFSSTMISGLNNASPTSHVHQPRHVPAQSHTKPTAATGQDRVELSAAALKATGDADHDGDSK